MKTFQTVLAFWLFIACSALSIAQTGQGPGKPTLEFTLSMMDNAAQGFHSLSADIEHIKYTAIVKDTSTETGQIFVRKDAKMRIDFLKPDPRTILRNGDNLYIYTPKIQRVEEYNIGKNREMADQYLALGFGTRTENLKKNYQITLAGEQVVNGQKTAVLDLVPNWEEMRKQIAKIQIWIDESSWLPVQEKFLEPGTGDYVMTRYTNVLENLKIADHKFKPDWPKGTKVEKPRG